MLRQAGSKCWGMTRSRASPSTAARGRRSPSPTPSSTRARREAGWARCWRKAPWTPPGRRDLRCCRSARSSADTSSAIPPISISCRPGGGLSSSSLLPPLSRTHRDGPSGVPADLRRPEPPPGRTPLMPTAASEPADVDAERARIRAAHLTPAGERPPSTARGLHHTALISSDVERTVRFYQDVLGFPLTELIENRDYPGSSHFFFDLGNGNLLAFFDFPGLDVGPYAEVLGGLHHVAISVEPGRWQQLVQRLTDAEVEHELHSGVSIYFRDPDGARLELIADPLGEMYGQRVL